MTYPAGVFEPLAKLSSFIRRGDKPNIIVYAISVLMEVKNRLDEVKRRLDERYGELAGRALRSLESGDRQRALMYAGELLNVRNLYKIADASQLAIEKVIERLKTLDVVNDMRALGAVTQMLNQIRGKLETVMPDLATMVDRVISGVNSLTSATEARGFVGQPIVIESKEVQEILEEIERKADERTRASLRPLPRQLEEIVEMIQSVERRSQGQLQRTPSGEEVASRIIDRPVEAIPTAYQPPVSSIQPAIHQSISSDIQKSVGAQIIMIPALNYRERMIMTKVYEYIVLHGGFIDVEDCAKRLGVTRDEVRKALKQLEVYGLIKIEE